jgi:hypothetical protein
MGKILFASALSAALFLIQAAPSSASDVHVAPVTAYVEANIRPWVEDPLIIDALKSQNLRHSTLSQTAIDAKGLSAGESEVSSDYWQGDELKWQKTYLAGSPVLFVDAAEKDESTQMLQSQASLTISDPQTGKPLGAITIGINLDAL